MTNDIITLLKGNENNKELMTFITTNQITDAMLVANYDVLQQYINSYNLCKKRENLNKCQQAVPGYRLKLTFNHQQIKTVLTDCLHRINNLDKKEVINKFLIRYYDDELLSLVWAKHFIGYGAAREKIVHYLKELLKNDSYPGLYLYGETNVGKTFIFILLANKLIQKKHTVCFVSWPEFVSDIKKSFKGENDSTSKIDQLKTCDYLFIDDLGNEAVSAWERDELLFPILNNRVLPLKTTFISSSFNFNDLATCYMLQKSKVETVKAKRLIDRIQKLTIPIKLTVPAQELTNSQKTNIANEADLGFSETKNPKPETDEPMLSIFDL